MGKIPRSLLFVILTGLSLTSFWGPRAGYAAGQIDHLYVTGKVMEIDRCASAWLIKRYIDENAVFAFLTDEELMVAEHFSFDTPFSKYRRTHRASTFEALRQGYSVNNDRVDYLAEMIHEIEINYWNKGKKSKVARFKFELEKRLRGAPDNQTALNRCFNYLDALPLL